MPPVRRRLLLTLTVSLPIALLAALTGVPSASLPQLATRFAGLPQSVWVGLVMMGALVGGAWVGLAIKDDNAGTLQ